MVRYEDECVDCGLPCLGDACKNRNVRRLYCDRCLNEVDTLFVWDETGEQLCEDCLCETAINSSSLVIHS